ncbi:hypothetical protein BV898_14109 [Hypsibius exemplaris]|uniref:Uncharacterized protein n=1 Tax=Hypsibius exemplaris TaxID=2072580 RepID=A0A1W0W8S6_HYPEX|nr:hypothetical protein BV898_14109 [Hypsibius exemplaris]
MRKLHTLIICIFICGLVGELDADGFEDIQYDTDDWSRETGKPVTTSPTRGRTKPVFSKPLHENLSGNRNVKRYFAQCAFILYSPFNNTQFSLGVRSEVLAKFTFLQLSMVDYIQRLA